MTKKDYKAIAAILADALESSDTPQARLKVIGIVHRLTRYFRSENEKFNSTKFRNACGIYDGY